MTTDLFSGTVFWLFADVEDSNLPALEAVLADPGPFHVDQMVVAGDVIHRGPFSAPVPARVVEAGWPVIRGNNELYLMDCKIEYGPAPYRLGWLTSRAPAPLLS